MHKTILSKRQNRFYLLKNIQAFMMWRPKMCALCSGQIFCACNQAPRQSQNQDFVAAAARCANVEKSELENLSAHQIVELLENHIAGQTRALVAAEFSAAGMHLPKNHTIKQKMPRQKLAPKVFFKKLAVCSMAIFLGLTAVFGVANATSAAPLGAGLIAPKPTDPVIYTTESGLDIRWANAPDSLGTLATGNLTGYPYFYMGTYNGMAVPWVVIGRNSDATQFYKSGIQYLFRTWQANQQTALLAKYFFDGQYETSSPSGSDIEQNILDNTFVVDSMLSSWPNVVVANDTDIPSGCVLALSLYTLSAAIFNEEGTNSSNYEGSKLQSVLQGMYSSTLGLSATQKAWIVPQTFTNIYYPSNTSTSTNQYFFPLAYRGEKFDVRNYLTSTTQRRATYLGNTAEEPWTHYWLRSGSDWLSNGNELAVVVLGSGYSDVGGTTSSTYFNLHTCRPAFVMKM